MNLLRGERRFIPTVPDKTVPAGHSAGQKSIHYYADSTCTGCGTCERVCPSGKIRLNDGQPIWQSAVPCYFCYACFNFCPEQAILLKIYSKKNGRYHHPAVSADDIAQQKHGQ